MSLLRRRKVRKYLDSPLLYRQSLMRDETRSETSRTTQGRQNTRGDIGYHQRSCRQDQSFLKMSGGHQISRGKMRYQKIFPSNFTLTCLFYLGRKKSEPCQKIAPKDLSRMNGNVLLPMNWKMWKKLTLRLLFQLRHFRSKGKMNWYLILPYPSVSCEIMSSP